MWRGKLVALTVAALMAGCAQFARQGDSGAPSLSYSEAQARYQQGLTSYRENRFDSALADLNAAAESRRLKSADEVNARKHIAFIHCASARELQCREQFQAILKEDPKFDLAANEAGHPLWGPVWRSIKGAAEEQRAVTRASGILATAAQQKLAEGIKEYDAGRYNEALTALQAAIKAGLPARADEVRARKYSAFIYCLTKHRKQCRAEFRQIFAIEPSFELLPSEAGHPAWSSAYRRAKTAAKQAASGQKKKARKKTSGAKSEAK